MQDLYEKLFKSLSLLNYPDNIFGYKINYYFEEPIDLLAMFTGEEMDSDINQAEIITDLPIIDKLKQMDYIIKVLNNEPTQQKEWKCKENVKQDLDLQRGLFDL